LVEYNLDPKDEVVNQLVDDDHEASAVDGRVGAFDGATIATAPGATNETVLWSRQPSAPPGAPRIPRPHPRGEGQGVGGWTRPGSTESSTA